MPTTSASDASRRGAFVDKELLVVNGYAVTALGRVLIAERKAAMISNPLVVLVGDREVTPVINTGTLCS